MSAPITNPKANAMPIVIAPLPKIYYDLTLFNVNVNKFEFV
jgi:hypothetical protein